jgi:hypothetical protein
VRVMNTYGIIRSCQGAGRLWDEQSLKAELSMYKMY